MSAQSRYLSRKDLCALLECAPIFLSRNEKRLGLDKARCDLNRWEARYFRGAALRILLERGLIEPENNGK